MSLKLELTKAEAIAVAEVVEGWAIGPWGALKGKARTKHGVAAAAKIRQALEAEAQP